MKKLLVFFAGMMMVGMTTVKAQPGDDNVYRIGPFKLNNGTQATLKFDFNIYGLEFCNPLRVNVEGKSGFYFDKPILNPIMKGYSMVFDLYKGSDPCELPADPSNSIDFKVDGVTKLKIASNGLIFIPAYTGLLFGDKSGEGNNRISIIQYGPHGYIDYKENLHFRADKNWISALTLYGDGSVGVGFGTTYLAGQYLTMGYKLAVNGGILCEEITVINDVPDADFVFEKGYNLAPLAKVEAFVKENKHLPDVPSAEEFKTNGYKVGDMDKMLLQKIEELTLYTIEQQKLIEDLQKRLSELEAKKGGE